MARATGVPVVPRARHLAREARRRLPYHAYRFASFLANELPRPVAEGVFAGLSVGAAFTLRGRRAALARNLERVHGGPLAALDREVRVQQAFHSYGRYWLESFRLPWTRRDELEVGMSWEGVAHLEDALAAGRGAIMALPHLGGWDFGGAWLATVGYPLLVVVEEIEPVELFEWMSALRRTIGLTVVPNGRDAGSAVLRALRGNGIVGLLCDRDLTGGGIEVEFFGERTTLPAGPATLALRTGAALLPTTIYYRGRGHHGIIRPPLPLDRQGSFRADAARVTALLAAELEGLIRAAPEQWHLFQPNWPSDPGYRG